MVETLGWSHLTVGSPQFDSTKHLLHISRKTNEGNFSLTMLARLFETRKQVTLNIKIFWLLCEEDLVPALSCGPSSRLAVF